MLSKKTPAGYAVGSLLIILGIAWGVMAGFDMFCLLTVHNNILNIFSKVEMHWLNLALYPGKGALMVCGWKGLESTLGDVGTLFHFGNWLHLMKDMLQVFKKLMDTQSNHCFALNKKPAPV
jgi:hypothetical protein